MTGDDLLHERVATTIRHHHEPADGEVDSVIARNYYAVGSMLAGYCLLLMIPGESKPGDLDVVEHLMHEIRNRANSLHGREVRFT